MTRFSFWYYLLQFVYIYIYIWTWQANVLTTYDGLYCIIRLTCPPGWKSPSCRYPTSRSEPASTYCCSSGHLRFILPTVWHFPSHHVSQAAAESLTLQAKLAAKPKPKRILTRQEPHEIFCHAESDMFKRTCGPMGTKVAYVCLYLYPSKYIYIYNYIDR